MDSIHVIGDVLPASVLEPLQRGLEQAEFVAGDISAGGNAASVKHNLQLVHGSALARTAAQQVLRALAACAEFNRVARPRSILPPLFARYDVGMSYGAHRDNPLMGRGSPLRTDLSLTLFLSSPESYEGGELVLYSGGERRSVKAAAGSVAVYQAGCRHEVLPVTAGQRLVCVTWIESLVADAAQRRVLYDLSTALSELSSADGSTSARDRLEMCEDALLRMWVRT